VSDILTNNITTKQLSCSVTYAGNWPPTMKWFTQSDKSIIHKSNPSNITSNGSTVYTSTVNMSDLKSGGNLTCMTSFFPPISTSSNESTSIPEYNYTWTSPPIDITKHVQLSSIPMSPATISVTSKPTSIC